MPSLIGAQNIRDFVACVAHGMLLEAIEDRSGGKLLYAAQVAFATQGGRLQNKTLEEEHRPTPLFESPCD
jgi:hypothetical protein